MTRILLRAGALLASLWLCAASPLRAQFPQLTGDASACVGETYTYTVTNPPPGGVSWGTLAPAIPAEVLAVNSSSITVRWTAPANFTLCADPIEAGATICLAVTIADAEALTISTQQGVACAFGEDQPNCKTYCIDDAILVEATGSGPIDWSATGAVTLVPGVTTATVTVIGPGTFTVIGSRPGADGCPSVDTLCGTVDAPIPALITQPALDANRHIEVCAGQRLTFGYAPPVQQLQQVEFRLSNGAVSSGPEFGYDFEVPGSYTLELYTASRCGCFELVDSVTVQVHPGEQFEVICPPIVCAGETVDYRLNIGQGQGRFCREVSWSFVGAADTVRLDSNHYRVTWPASGTATGQVILTPGPGCAGCPVPTVLEVPILGAPIIPTLGTGRCAPRSQFYVAPQIPGAMYTWDDVTPGGPLTTIFPTGGGHSAFVVFSSDTLRGSVANIRLTIASEIGNCISEATFQVAFGPTFRLEPAPACAGGSLSVIATPPVSGSIDYTYGNQSGRWNYSAPLVLGPVVPGASMVTLSNLEVGGVSYSQCVTNLSVESRAVPDVEEIFGPTTVCENGTYLYSVAPPAGFTGTITWMIDTTGSFVPDSGPTASGNQVLVTWRKSGRLTVVYAYGNCEGETFEIKVSTEQTEDIQIEGNGFPCVDAPAPELYTLTCGGGVGVACGIVRSVTWSIDPALGSIVSGQGTTQVGILWHLPTGGGTSATILADFGYCDGEVQDQRTFDVELQAPEPVDITVAPEPNCAGEPFTFTVAPNPNLTVASVAWVVRDSRGITYSAATPSGTWTWDSGAAMPEVTSGLARVFATVTYAECSFVDLGSAGFTILHNPIPVLSYVEPDSTQCDSLTGQPLATTVRFVTSNSASAAAVTYVWQQNCGSGWQLVPGANAGTRDIFVDPAAGCRYRVTLTRVDGAAPGGSCTRTSNEVAVTWPCGRGDCSLDPKVNVLSNSGLIGAGNCGTVFVEGLPGGNPEDLRLTYGEWAVFPPTTPPLGTGPTTSVVASQIAQFSNLPWELSRFQQPGLYYAEYTIGRGPDTCMARAPFEITLVPALSAALACGTNPDNYRLTLRDLTEVIDSATITDYSWTVYTDQNELIATGDHANENLSVPAPETSYTGRVCLRVTAPAVVVNPGAAYTCDICEDLLVPGRPISEFAVADTAVCAGTSFTFTYDDPNDPFDRFSWDFGDGLTGSQLPAPTKVYANAGAYPVTLTHTNSIGCSRETQIEVIVNEGFVSGELVSAFSDDCKNAVVLQVKNLDGNDPFAFTWSPVTANSQQITVTQTGIYDVTITDANGCRYSPPAIPVVVQQAFSGPLALSPEPTCTSERTCLDLPLGNTGLFQYFYRVDAGPTMSAYSPICIQAGGINPGVHTLTVEARTSEGVVCETLEGTFTVLESEVPPAIELQSVSCDPALRLVYGTADGRTADWFVDFALYGRGPTIEVGVDQLVRRLRAETPGALCPSTLVEADLPAGVDPRILAGCFMDCDDLPTDLRDLSGGSYASWEWVYIPEGATAPMTCPNQPGPGTGTVTPWNNFYCGDGDYFLRVTVAFATGDTCELTSDVLCVNCETPAACTPPEWLARDLACLAAEGGIEYYVNFDTDIDMTPGASMPCGGSTITLSGGTVVGGGFAVTVEDGAYNVEGRVLVPTGTPLSAVCLTIPYCDNASQSCGAETVCLSESSSIPVAQNCPVGCADAEAAIDDIAWGCPSDQPTQENFVTTVTIENLAIDLPAGCTPDAVRMFQVNGQLGDRGAGWDLVIDSGGNLDWRLAGSVTAGQFRVPSLVFDYVTFPNQRQACFNVLLGGCNCAVSVCLDVPLGCYPPDENPVVIPLVECEDGAEGLQTYSVWVPLAPGETVAANAGVVGLSAGGSGTIVSVAPDAVRIVITVPAGANTTWVMIGDTTAARTMNTLNGPLGSQPATVQMPSVASGDLLRHLRLPPCATGEVEKSAFGRSLGRTPATSPQAELTDAVLAITPNPARDRIALRLVTQASDAELDWSTIRVNGVTGAVGHLPYAGPARSAETELSVRDLAPGVYFVVVRTTDGRSVGARFVKQ